LMTPPGLAPTMSGVNACTKARTFRSSCSIWGLFTYV
jgi:hypothetical protein